MRISSILLIDDDDFHSLSISVALSNCNLKVDMARSLAEGHRILIDKKPTVVIFGAGMTDNISLNQSLKYSSILNRKYPGIKIIFITKKAYKQTVYKVFNTGCNSILCWPLNFSRLLREVVEDTSAIQRA
ncbi:hypothetical protein JCM14036_17250 [Desulfotomaculum defluvii]